MQVRGEMWPCTLRSRLLGAREVAYYKR